LQQQQQYPYQPPLQQQKQQRAAGAGYLKNVIRRRQAGVREPSAASGGTGPAAPYSGYGWEGVEGADARRSAYALPPGTTQQVCAKNMSMHAAVAEYLRARFVHSSLAHDSRGCLTIPAIFFNQLTWCSLDSTQ